MSFGHIFIFFSVGLINLSIIRAFNRVSNIINCRLALQHQWRWICGQYLLFLSELLLSDHNIIVLIDHDLLVIFAGKETRDRLSTIIISFLSTVLKCAALCCFFLCHIFCLLNLKKFSFHVLGGAILDISTICFNHN